MIKLKSLLLYNFLSFQGLHTIEFPENGLVFLKGICNDNTALSNGAGKSSLLEGIAYALGYGSSPATELKNWQSEDEFSVILLINYNGNELRISRSAGLYQVVYQDVIYRSQGAKDLLKSLLYIPECISFMTYRPQGVDGNFLSLNNNDKFEFLSNLLDMSKIEKAVLAAQNKNKALEDKLQAKNLELDYAERDKRAKEITVADLRANLVRYEVKKNELNQELEKKLKIDFRAYFDQCNLSVQDGNKQDLLQKQQALQLSLKLLEPEKLSKLSINAEKLNNRIDELNKALEWHQQEFAKTPDYSKEQWQADVDACDEKIKEYRFNVNVVIKNISGYESKIFKKLDYQDKRDKLLNKTCFTCKRAWDGDVDLLANIEEELKYIIAAEFDLPSLKVQIKNHENIILDLELQKNAFNKQYENKCTHAKQIKDLILEIAREKDGVQMLSSSLESQYQKKQAQIEKDLQAVDNKIENLGLDYECSYKVALAAHSSDIELLKGKVENNEFFIKEQRAQLSKIDLAEADKKIDNIKFDIAKITCDKQIEEEVINCLGKDNFSSLIFQDVLSSISNLANEFLRNIPNASSFLVTFETEKMTQKGTIKKGVNLKIFQNGQERSYKMLSGGEKGAINFSIDIAISHVLSNRFGKAFSWIIYDEPFDAMDVFSKAESVEFLKKIASDKLIILVEHNNEIAELFDKFITVKKENGFSAISTNF